MLAPRRVPPCLIASVATSNTCISDTGPEAVPPVEATRSPAGRSRENEKPVPPPVFWISAAHRTASNTPVVESSTGTTKQAASWPSGRPAFIRVGELGRNSSDDIMRSNASLGGGDLRGAVAQRGLGGGDVPRDPVEQLLGGLDHDAAVAHQVAGAQDGEGVVGERRKHVRTVRSAAWSRNRPRRRVAWLLLAILAALIALVASVARVHAAPAGDPIDLAIRYADALTGADRDRAAALGDRDGEDQRGRTKRSGRRTTTMSGARPTMPAIASSQRWTAALSMRPRRTAARTTAGAR